jgi:hypothetical protein
MKQPLPEAEMECIKIIWMEVVTFTLMMMLLMFRMVMIVVVVFLILIELLEWSSRGSAVT